MRLAGKQKLGYFPLPLAEAERIRRFLKFPISGCATLDPCIGDGGAFHAIAGDPQAIRYGTELDAYRVEQAREVTHQIIHGDALDVHCPVESLSLLYLNPPYDFECGQWQNRRLEQIFFEHCYRRLKPAGVLVLVVPGDRLSVCGRVLAFHFKEKRAYRLGTPEAVKYKQVVLFGARRTRRECNQLSDADLSKAQNLISEMSRRWEQLTVLPDSADVIYSVPESGPVELVHRGLPLDEIDAEVSSLSPGRPDSHGLPTTSQWSSVDSVAWRPCRTVRRCRSFGRRIWFRRGSAHRYLAIRQGHRLL